MHVTVAVRNPDEPDRFREGLFLVDAGATDSLVPGPHLEAIGLRPKGRRVYETADGRRIATDVTAADMEFMGDMVGGTVPFGGDEAEPAPARHRRPRTAGIEVDPLNLRLKRLPAMRLKSVRPTA